jgi:hypothetical protein
VTGLGASVRRLHSISFRRGRVYTVGGGPVLSILTLTFPFTSLSSSVKGYSDIHQRPDSAIDKHEQHLEIAL